MLGPTERKPFVPACSIFAVGKGIEFDNLEDESETASSQPDDLEPGTVSAPSYSFAMNHGFPVHVEGMSQWSNDVYLTNQEPWRGDQVKMRTFDWVNEDRHERGIRHIEYEFDSTRYPWVRPTALARDTPAIVSHIDSVKAPPGFGPQPEALSGEALQRWEQDQHNAFTRRQARLNMLESVDQDRKDSAQDKKRFNSECLGRSAKRSSPETSTYAEQHNDGIASGAVSSSSLGLNGLFMAQDKVWWSKKPDQNQTQKQQAPVERT